MPNAAAIQSLLSLQAEVYRAAREWFQAEGDQFVNCPGLAELMFACVQPRSDYEADNRVKGYTVVDLSEGSILLDVLNDSFGPDHRVWRHIRTEEPT